MEPYMTIGAKINMDPKEVNVGRVVGKIRKTRFKNKIEIEVS